MPLVRRYRGDHRAARTFPASPSDVQLVRPEVRRSRVAIARGFGAHRGAGGPTAREPVARGPHHRGPPLQWVRACDRRQETGGAERIGSSSHRLRQMYGPSSAQKSIPSLPRVGPHACREFEAFAAGRLVETDHDRGEHRDSGHGPAPEHEFSCKATLPTAGRPGAARQGERQGNRPRPRSRATLPRVDVESDVARPISCRRAARYRNGFALRTGSRAVSSRLLSG
jgi:hypothetical protein